MKRDMELIRQILLLVEEYPEPDGAILPAIDGYSQQEIAYHVKLLADASLIEARDFSAGDNCHWVARHLTWQGHEFLDAARHDTIWGKAKKMIQDQGGSIPFTVLQSLLVELAKGLVGLK